MVKSMVSSSEVLLGKWVEHFGKVAKSRLESVDGLRDMMLKVDGLVHTSFDNEELLLDVPFKVDEVKAAIRKLKCSKAAGLDGLVAEHLKYAGESMVIWLRNIMNALMELEMIPDFLKKAVVVPVYKGGGKDPLLMNSYRGITLTSILSKVLKFLILDRLHDLLEVAGIPHINQTAYRRKVSCADAIFATQEVIAKYVGSGSKVLMCLYDLEKAYDSVEYPVLLERLFEVGINGKLWRVMKNWYSGGSSFVKVDGKCSSLSYGVGRGVKQGSILSPVLFLLVMDPLLKKLQDSSLGLSLNSYYAGVI